MSTQPRPSADVLLERLDSVRRLALRLVRDAADADDLVQEAVAAALSRPTPVRGDGDGWIAAMLHNLARDRARRAGRRDRREKKTARPEASGVDTRTLVENAERQRDVVEAVLSLDDPYRETLLLRFFEDLPPREIVQRTGRTPAAVRKHIDRGLAQVRAKLEKQYGDRGQWAVALLPVVGSKGLTQLGVKTAATAAVPTAAPTAALRAAAVALLLVGVGVPAALLLRGGEEAQVEPIEVARVGVEESVPELASLDGGGERAAEENVDHGGDHNAEHVAPAEPLVVAAQIQRPEVTKTVRLVGLDGEPFRNATAEWSWRLVYGGEPLESELLVPAQTDADGRTTVTGPRFPAFDQGPWTVDGRRFHSAGSIDAGDETVVVLAPAVRLAGRVVTPDGEPFSGATVSVLADASRVPGFPLRSEKGPYQVGLRVETEADGRFEIASFPSHPSFSLSVRAEGYFGSRQPIPATDALDLELSIGRSTPLRRRITGTVFESTGAPAPGVAVRFGQFDAETDVAGRFEIQVPHRPARYRVSAQVEDGRFAVAASPVDSHEIAAGDVDGIVEDAVVLRLPEALQPLRGRLVDANGAPAAGYEVIVFDGTNKGSSSACFEDPGFGEKHTGQDGRFVLEAVAERPYTLRFLDRETMHVHDSAPLTPGDDEHIVTIPADAFVDALRGRVVDVYGEPVRGAQIELKADLNPRERGAWSSHSGRTTETDDDGSFVIEDAPWYGLWINVNPRPGSHDYGVAHEIGEHRPDGTIELQLEFECGVHVRTSRSEIVEIGAVDAAGERLGVKLLTAGVTSFEYRVSRGENGDFPLFDVSQRATTFVLYGENGEIARMPVQLDPSERNELSL